MPGGYFPKAELAQPLPEGLLDASTWTIPCPSVLLMLMAEHDTREAVSIWGYGLISMNKYYKTNVVEKSLPEHSQDSDNAAA